MCTKASRAIARRINRRWNWGLAILGVSLVAFIATMAAKSYYLTCGYYKDTALCDGITESARWAVVRVEILDSFIFAAVPYAVIVVLRICWAATHSNELFGGYKCDEEHGSDQQ